MPAVDSAPCVQLPVSAFQSSALVFMPVSSLSTVLPPVTTTLPSARTVALAQIRNFGIEGLFLYDGVAPLMSITAAAFLPWACGPCFSGRVVEPPPQRRILPGAYMTSVEFQPLGPSDGISPAEVMLLAFGST